MNYRAVFCNLMVVASALLLGACGSFVTAPPSESWDGLVLQPDTRFGEVYLRPGAVLSDYDTFGITSCQVAFKKNWLRNQNNSRLDLSNRVTQQDVDKIKDWLSADCDTYFREALQQPPAYKLVDSFENGEAVLIVRPAIVNLDIAAPDTMSAGMQRNYTTSAGEMTLVLELLDGTTGQIQVRILDRQRRRDTHYLQFSNSVTNRAEARRFLKAWASQLREGLDSVTAGAATSEQGAS